MIANVQAFQICVNKDNNVIFWLGHPVSRKCVCGKQSTPCFAPAKECNRFNKWLLGKSDNILYGICS